ncbi:MAG TPA: ABC transporter ATP-binding protein [Aggregicoccus sp.]|nr:ABC transporter ATP-binding protein [Aggregicoccus sp.]
MIDVQSVRKRFGPVVALDGVSLSVRPGERVALVGTNGSGKTTLLRALCGLLRVEGRVHLYGEDVARVPQRALARLAYMPQVAPPLEVPVAELVRAHCALRSRTPAQVAERARRLGLDLESVARTRVRDLSGGMKQKLLAALALTAEAPVLVCDEPTANLDAHARAAFFEEVNARDEDDILVLCSHRLEEVRHLVDRVIELKDGRVVKDAPLSQVLSSLRTFRVELAFGEAVLDEPALGQLRAQGFARVAPGRFLGVFQGVEKMAVISGLVAAFGDRLVDLSVLDAESLAEAEAVPRLRRVK